MREGRRLTVHLLPGDPHALLLEADVASFRPEALRHLGLAWCDTEMLCAAAAIEDELEIAAELFLSVHAVRERLERIEAKLDVRTAKPRSRGIQRKRVVLKPRSERALLVVRPRKVLVAGIAWTDVAGAGPGSLPVFECSGAVGPRSPATAGGRRHRD